MSCLCHVYTYVRARQLSARLLQVLASARFSETKYTNHLLDAVMQPLQRTGHRDVQACYASRTSAMRTCNAMYRIASAIQNSLSNNYV